MPDFLSDRNSCRIYEVSYILQTAFENTELVIFNFLSFSNYRFLITISLWKYLNQCATSRFFKCHFTVKFCLIPHQWIASTPWQCHFLYRLVLQAVELLSWISLLTGGMISMSSKGAGFTYLGWHINFQFSKRYALISQKAISILSLLSICLVRQREAVVYATNFK